MMVNGYTQYDLQDNLTLLTGPEVTDGLAVVSAGVARETHCRPRLAPHRQRQRRPSRQRIGPDALSARDDGNRQLKGCISPPPTATPATGLIARRIPPPHTPSLASAYEYAGGKLATALDSKFFMRNDSTGASVTRCF